MASTMAYGTATGPAGGATIASVVLASKGRYRVTVITGVEGTANATDQNNNMQLLNSGGTVGVVMASSTGSARTLNPDITVDVVAGGTLAVVAVATAGTAAIYSASLIVTPDALF